MRRLAIYTCITGGYEALAEPRCVCPDADYVCFTDNASLLSEQPSATWQYRPLAHVEADPVRSSRWHKLSPGELFPEYGYTLWLDGNIDIASMDFHALVASMMAEEVACAALPHPGRDDIYEEAFRIVADGRDSMLTVAKAVRFLSGEGMPRHFGLFETGVMLRHNGDARVREADRLWLDTLSRYSRRDQLSHSYALWKTGLEPRLFIPSGTDVRTHPFFSYVVHVPPYVKDRSLKGLCRDAAAAARRTLFRIWLRLLLLGK